MELPFTVNGIKAYYADSAEFDIRKIPESQAYVLDADGWNLYLRNTISESLNNIRLEGGMPKLKAQCWIRSEKIPYALIKKVGKFFTDIYKLHRSEACGYLYYAPSKGWLFWPPPQTATTAHCKYGEPKQIEGYRVAGTIHSHGSMSAYHSGTDEKDEANFDGVHITIGKVDEVRHELALSIVTAGVRYKCTEDQLLSGFGDVSVPEEWIDAVRKESPTTTSTGVTIIDNRSSHSAHPQNQSEGHYKHFYSEDEWNKLSKEQKKAIKKAQKKDEAEGNGMLSFFDVRRYGHWG